MGAGREAGPTGSRAPLAGGISQHSCPVTHQDAPPWGVTCLPTPPIQASRLQTPLAPNQPLPAGPRGTMEGRTEGLSRE